ncbi:alpha/beta hydrolase [Cerasicoccus maritimus]|uniref:alpha/beta hydrolase n=1 Tax=Cerasicoccus maritimus TaxID=490089 RepID=UPI0028526CE5|nr:alpha/beta hydrolase [Cerasicoccus maritimus]
MTRKKRRMIWQIINGLAIGLVVSYLGLCLFAVFFSDRMIFPAPEPSYTDSKDIVKLPLRNGNEIATLYLENPDAKYTILYSHGNGEDIGMIRPFLEQLRDQGFSVLAYDYPGYGISDGRPTEQGALEAAANAFSYLAMIRDVDPDKVILFGRSLGSGPSWALAAKKPVAGMIIDGGFSSTFRVVTKKKIVPWDKFDNLALVDQVQCPILLMHGGQDRTVPFAHAEELFTAYDGPKSSLFIAEAGHNNLVEAAGPRYWDAIRQFTESLK